MPAASVCDLVSSSLSREGGCIAPTRVNLKRAEALETMVHAPSADRRQVVWVFGCSPFPSILSRGQTSKGVGGAK